MEKRILFFTGGMGRGGAERVITLLSGQYVKNGWKVSIAMVLHNLVSQQIPDEVEVVSLADREGSKLGAVGTCIRIRRYVKQFKPTVIVSFLSPVCVLADIALHNISIPIIMSERIDPFMAKRSKLFSSAVKRAYSHSDLFIAQTQKAKSYFSEEVQRKSMIIPNPVRVETLRKENSKKRIVTAGRLTEQKNHKMLIDAFNQVHKKHPEYSLEIYGDGECRGTLAELIRHYGLENSVTLKGAVSDLHCQISDAEIFVLSSDYEGLSNAFLEAMMMGFPVISTNCAGADEYIKNKENGILIPVGDTDALVDAMLFLIEHDVEREQMGKEARKAVEGLKVENIIDKWTMAIETVIAQK